MGILYDTPQDPRIKLEKLVKRFTTPQTKVIVYLAPMTAGEQDFDYFQSIYKGLVSNTAYRLANPNFGDPVHLNPKGALINSKIIANFVKKKFDLTT